MCVGEGGGGVGKKGEEHVGNGIRVNVECNISWIITTIAILYFNIMQSVLSVFIHAYEYIYN